jgi:hypothetical protein
MAFNCPPAFDEAAGPYLQIIRGKLLPHKSWLINPSLVFSTPNMQSSCIEDPGWVDYRLQYRLRECELALKYQLTSEIHSPR